MKNLIIAVALAVFALVPAAQAGEGKQSAKNRIASVEKAKTACPDTVSSSCPDKDKSAQASCAAGCSAKDKLTKKTVRPAEKGGMLLAKR